MKQRNAELLIAIISMVWGSSYLLAKLGLGKLEVFNLIALRLGIAFVITAAIFIKRITRVSINTLCNSAILGTILFSSFAFLSIGLKTTSASLAGFLTSSTVVFVLILQVIITRALPNLPIAVGSILTLCGIGFLMFKQHFAFEISSILCVLSALSFAGHVVATNHLTHKSDSLLLGIFQLGFAALLGCIFSGIFETPSLPHDEAEWLIVLVLAIMCSALGFVLQPVAQRYTTPERTSLLFSLEPVFAAILGYIFLHEVLQLKDCIGAALVLFSIFIASINDDKKGIREKKSTIDSLVQG